MRFSLAFIFSFLASFSFAEERQFDSNGTKINYLDEGKGETVLLIHGFGGSAEEHWTKMPLATTQILPVLAKEFRVIAPDVRGHGKSDKPHDPQKYGIEIVGDMIRLLDHLRIQKCHVVGYSMGSTVAGKLMTTHPERLLSVTLGGGGPIFQASKEFVAAAEATAESLDQGKGMGPLILALASDEQPKMTQEQASTFSKLVIGKKDQKALAAVLRGQVGLFVTEQELKANNIPVRFIYGSQETIMKELIQGSQKILPHAEVKIIKNKDHVTTIADSEFRKSVLEFLRANKIK